MNNNNSKNNKPFFLVVAIPTIILLMLPLAMAQTNQLFHLEQFAKLRGVQFPPILPVTIHSYKLLLAAQIEMDEQGDDPSNPVNSTVNNPDLANLDTQILNYLCEIDKTYCAGGDNYPLK
jgi:hypothetical protein